MKWSLMLLLTEPPQLWRPPWSCPLRHTLAPCNLGESHTELLSAMAFLDFKTFLVLGYLPIADSLPFCLSFFSCVCALSNLTCVWISGIWVVFLFQIPFLSALRKGEEESRAVLPAQRCSFPNRLLILKSFSHHHLLSLEDEPVSREAGDGCGCRSEEGTQS